ncbi:hypothetical protein U14_01377 [Candidatus Moduliflexus flocculans]|uniref:DUF2281 domain-containing protein n=1 Tax=Candidatus Moduliflexus flocculans TaxID=1499966 RepID=A0A0S6VXZ2_9BACT|nr:hypothetical protein U14_01377 [Candidatus Moduliflexus flocculans]
MLSVKERVAHAIELLHDDELRMVEEYVAFLHFRARTPPKMHFNQQQLASLYAECAEEDRLLAEEGMSEYVIGLQKEDA